MRISLSQGDTPPGVAQATVGTARGSLSRADAEQHGDAEDAAGRVGLAPQAAVGGGRRPAYKDFGVLVVIAARQQTQEREHVRDAEVGQSKQHEASRTCSRSCVCCRAAIGEGDAVEPAMTWHQGSDCAQSRRMAFSAGTGLLNTT